MPKKSDTDANLQVTSNKNVIRGTVARQQTIDCKIPLETGHNKRPKRRIMQN